MTNTLLNISGKIDAATVAVYSEISTAAKQLEMPFVVVGASARDLILHYGYGAQIQRATTDVDFGIQVANWRAFFALKKELISKGFKETQSQHRLVSRAGIQVDLVPFGKLEDGETNIQWPPNGDIVMSVLGFKEACASSEIVCIQDDPEINIPVATPKGMVLLKLIAWLDRPRSERLKDAKDLTYLFTTYEKIPAVNHGLYEDTQLLENYGWDTALAGAHQLGSHAASIAQEKTSQIVMELFDNKNERTTTEKLTEEMCEHVEQDYDRNENLLSAFMAGFKNVFAGEAVNDPNHQ